MKTKVVTTDVSLTRRGLFAFVAAAIITPIAEAKGRKGSKRSGGSGSSGKDSKYRGGRK
jgi:hypothetical protein